MSADQDFAGTPWRKSNNSGDGGCVEVAVLADAVGVRDSKHPDGPVLIFTNREWAAFVAGVREGEFEPQ
jgi:hypothetical protein